MSTKTSECWTTDPNARAIKVEASPDRTLLLPFDQFVYSELTVTDTGQHLRLVFASHEVTLVGTGLRRIEAALQRMDLANLSKTEGRNPPALSSGYTSIHDILIAGAQAQGAEVVKDDHSALPPVDRLPCQHSAGHGVPI